MAQSASPSKQTQSNQVSMSKAKMAATGEDLEVAGAETVVAGVEKIAQGVEVFRSGQNRRRGWCGRKPPPERAI